MADRDWYNVWQEQTRLARRDTPGTLQRAQPVDAAPDPIAWARPLWSRRWLVVATTVIAIGLAALYTLTRTPLYEASARIVIEASPPNVVTFAPVVREDQQNREQFQTQHAILQSRMLAMRTLERSGLVRHPELSSGASPGEADGAALRDRAGVSPVPVDAFLRRLEAVPVRNSRVVELRFRAADPALAAEAVNALAREYVEYTREVETTASRDAFTWLSAQLAEQRHRVEASEQALQRYREEQGSVALDDSQNIVVQKLGDLNSALTRARTERIAKDSIIGQLRRLQQNPRDFETFPAVLSNPFIQQLKAELATLQGQREQLSEHLGERHPNMVRLQTGIAAAEAKLRAEIAKVIESSQHELRAAQAEEAQLRQELERQKQEALSLNRTAIGYGTLARDAASNRQVLEQLLQRAQETRVAGELGTSSARILDTAEVPQSPVYPRTSFNLLLALVTGGVLGVGLAWSRERFDPRIRTPQDIKEHLNLPFLGFAPAVQTRGTAFRPLVGDAATIFDDAFRAVRSNVYFSPLTECGRSLLVTSARIGEGKTLVAGNLAASLARVNQRVLLVDADMRRGRAHLWFGVERSPGLAEVIAGGVAPADAISPSGTPNLWVLPPGHLPVNAADVLTSSRFGRLLAQLGREFDWVIIDSPPVLAVPDACIMAKASTAVLFVVGAWMTNRETARAALEQLDGTGATFVGAVLNRADQGSGYLYEYGAYSTGSPSSESHARHSSFTGSASATPPGRPS